MEARTLRGALLPRVRDAAAAVKTMLLGLGRERCAAAAASLAGVSGALAQRPLELQAYMEFQVEADLIS